MTPHLSAGAVLAAAPGPLIAAVDLVGVGATLSGIGVIVGAVLTHRAQLKSRDASLLATSAAAGRRAIAEAQAAELAALRTQLEVRDRLIRECPVTHCPIRSELAA